jgi:Mce-associated membrane protein
MDARADRLEERADREPRLNRTSLTNPSVINPVLAVVLVGLCVWLALFAFLGDAAAPGKTPAEERDQEYSDITRAARAETLAFLTIDHTKMDVLTKQVLDGATGDFKKQYRAALKSLKESAAGQESYSKGRVDQLGLSEVDADSASVFVAAGSKVRNKGTKGKAEDRSWRIKLTMAKEGSRWLVSQLEFVG